MLRPLLAGLMLLSLAACDKKDAEAPEADASGGPQIATSLDEYALPADKSDQVTAIDAATGDATGMPRDGGAVVVAPKPEPRRAVEAVEPSNAAAPAPIVAPPPVVAPTAPAPAGN